MGSPEIEKIRDGARERAAGRPNLVLDGDPIEELARAHERHAERLEKVARDLRAVGLKNHLGETSEGRAATNNIRVAVHDHPLSVVQSYKKQAASARYIADSLRDIGRAIAATEAENSASIEAL